MTFTTGLAGQQHAFAGIEGSMNVSRSGIDAFDTALRCHREAFREFPADDRLQHDRAIADLGIVGIRRYHVDDVQLGAPLHRLDHRQVKRGHRVPRTVHANHYTMRFRLCHASTLIPGLEWLMAVLVLLRHGESAWNAADVFTGWIDVGLSDRGERQAQRAGELLAVRGFFPDVVHTSVQRRAIRSADLALAACGRPWVPVRRSWRLNSNHYGALQGRGKAEVRAEAGEEQFILWRRGYRVRPPLGEPDDDPRYAALPRTRCRAGSRCTT